MSEIHFNRPYITGKEEKYIKYTISMRKLSGDRSFTYKCCEWLERNIVCCKALLTHSCTAALEMSALLLNIKEGDEIIMPSYTFVSTANAFVLRGGVPVFVDIREDTLNIDETLIESAITQKTKAIVVVHYAGVACEMDTILSIAEKYSLPVIEDAAQGIMASYKGRALGSLGTFGTLSFHETKNITCGEGGAILINDPSYVSRAEIIREKGTNRKAFFKGDVDKYSWVDIGSSYLPGELAAAFLWAQMEQATFIQEKRLTVWNMYHELLEPLEKKGLLHRPIIPVDCKHNGHIYYIILPTASQRDKVISSLKEAGINAIFHYIPLHSSLLGEKASQVKGTMKNTEELSSRIVRLPMYCDMNTDEVSYVVDTLKKKIYSL